MLREIIQRRGLTLAEAGQQLGISEQHCWRLCAGRSLPGAQLMRRIHRWSRGRLRPDHWLLIDKGGKHGRD